jgi:ABC-type amino acid transport substrate-binding protein
VKSSDEAMAALASGKADAFASDKLLLVGASEKSKDPKSFNLLPDSLSFEPYGIALPRGDAAMRLAVNTGLAQIYGSGEIARIFDSWFAPFGPPSEVMQMVYIMGTIPQ